MNLDGASDKPRLTSDQKKKNHIESEKKRREAIRAGFERLSQIIPGCEGSARSEAVVLQATVQYLREQLERKELLRAAAYKKGMSEGEFEQVYRDVEKSAATAEEDDSNGGGAARAGSSKGGGR